MDYLDCHIFTVKIRILGNGRLPPFLGSAIRGVFGHTFRKISCVTKIKDCSLCDRKHDCPYAYVFETHRPESSDRMRLYPFVPHPFVFETPITNKTDYQQNDVISFRLILVGKGIEYYRHFVLALLEMGSKGLGKNNIPFTLMEIRDQDGNLVYDWEKNQALPLHEPLQIGVQDSNNGVEKLMISLITPLRYKYMQKLARHFIFRGFFSTALRRVSSLLYFHQDINLNLDFRGLVDQSNQIHVQPKEHQHTRLRRYSNRQKRPIDISGIQGDYIIEGKPTFEAPVNKDAVSRTTP